MLDWVVENKHRVRELILLGDVVDLWTYPFGERPPTFAQVRDANPAIFGLDGALARVLDALDGAVTWVEGNHDMGLDPAEVATVVSPAGHRLRLHPELNYQPLADDPRVLVSHGHRHTLFNAEDPDSPWDGLPCGHFVTRAVAEFWSHRLEPGQTVADLPGQGAPSGLDLTGLASMMAGLDGSGVTSMLFDYLTGTLGIDEHAPIVLASGETTTMAQARLAYAGRWASWARAAGGGVQGDIEAARAAIADFSEELGWYAQRDAFALGAELVVMGHTHTPVADLDNALVRYVNTGFTCPARADLATRSMNFVVIDAAEIEAQVWEIVPSDNGPTCQPAVAATEKIVRDGTMDYSCYIEVDNSTNPAPLTLDSFAAVRGRFVNEPPPTIPAHGVARLWVQDDLGPLGSHGWVTYRTGDRLVTIEARCPTGLVPNHCESTEPFTARSGHGHWGEQGATPWSGHPLFVRTAVQPSVPTQPPVPSLTLATSNKQIRPNYDVVVIGSGYGGSIAASRFARAGRRVCLLERGNERWPGDYPENAWPAIRQTQLTSTKRHIGSHAALFDVRLDNEVNVLVGRTRWDVPHQRQRGVATSP
ncbi:MAG: FAD-binding protein [Acidimicrobiales bacterium]